MTPQTNKPIISVITCLYNTPSNLFKKCLDGLVNQTFENFEVLIVNDGSDKYLNENKEIINSYNDKRFKYFDTEHTGKSQTLNFALSQAQGKYVAINDADDVSYPNRLEYQLHFLEFNSEYQVISNAMISVPDNILFPSNEPSQDVNSYNIYYNAVHPNMMFNRHVLSKVPFLFEQIYDSMEDNVFNHIMFYSGIKMYYDNTILMYYSKENPNAAHYDNLHGYKKDGTFKLSFRTFYHSELFKDSQFTCILLVNDNWNEELEKTILNIRYTSNNVKIIISCYDKYIVNEQYYNKYAIENFLYGDYSYNEALYNATMICDTEYLMVISKPIRFYVQDWDMYAIRNFQSVYQYSFIQPLMTGIDKIDRDNYYNNNGKNTTYKQRKGQYLIMLDKEMTDPKTNIDIYSEYVFTSTIPIIDDDLVFITRKAELQKILGEIHFDTNLLMNVYLSINEYLTGGHIYIDTDIKCGVIDNEINSLTNIENNFFYYMNYWKIVNIFFNETKFLYEKIIYENLSKEDAAYVINSINNDEFIKLKNSIKSTHVYDIGWFIKNINLKYPITFWTKL